MKRYQSLVVILLLKIVNSSSIGDKWVWEFVEDPSENLKPFSESRQSTSRSAEEGRVNFPKEALRVVSKRSHDDGFQGEFSSPLVRRPDLSDGFHGEVSSPLVRRPDLSDGFHGEVSSPLVRRGQLEGRSKLGEGAILNSGFVQPLEFHTQNHPQETIGDIVKGTSEAFFKIGDLVTHDTRSSVKEKRSFQIASENPIRAIAFVVPPDISKLPLEEISPFTEEVVSSLPRVLSPPINNFRERPTKSPFQDDSITEFSDEHVQSPFPPFPKNVKRNVEAILFPGVAPIPTSNLVIPTKIPESTSLLVADDNGQLPPSISKFTKELTTKHPDQSGSKQYKVKLSERGKETNSPGSGSYIIKIFNIEPSQSVQLADEGSQKDQEKEVNVTEDSSKDTTLQHPFTKSGNLIRNISNIYQSVNGWRPLNTTLGRKKNAISLSWEPQQKSFADNIPDESDEHSIKFQIANSHSDEFTDSSQPWNVLNADTFSQFLKDWKVLPSIYQKPEITNTKETGSYPSANIKLKTSFKNISSALGLLPYHHLLSNLLEKAELRNRHLIAPGNHPIDLSDSDI